MKYKANKHLRGMQTLKEVKATELLDFLKLFYDDLNRDKDWDIYLLHIQNGVKNLLPFEEWRKPKVKKTKEDILKDVKLILMAELKQ